MSYDEEFFKRLFTTFKQEGEERAQKIVNLLLELEKSSDQKSAIDAIEKIYREIHSLKSASRAVNVTEIEAVCQKLEDQFSNFKQTKTKPSVKEFDELHEKINFILKKFVHEMKEKQDGKEKTQSNKDQQNEETVRISSLKLDKLLLQSEEMLTTKINLTQRLSELTELKNLLLKGKREWDKMLPQQLVIKKCIQENKLEDKSINAQQKIMEFMNDSKNEIKDYTHMIDGIINKLEQDLHGFSVGIDNLLEDSKKLMLWPFSAALNFLPKTVRDLARSLDKDVELKIEGSELEIDKRILEEMKDVLLHLIRNAIDHGIESPKTRKESKKSEKGQLNITIQHMTGSEIQLEVKDDGGGIPLEALKESAVKQGHITFDEAYKMSDEEALELIYHSGVSTSKIISDLSGRGLGMAIIREKIESVGGKIEIKSQKNVGTTVIIKLPLTLATFKGMLIRLFDSHFIIPTANLERIIRVSYSDIKSIENRETILYGGKPCSLIWLKDLLGLGGGKDREMVGGHLIAVILTSNEHRIAYVVDEVINEQEILVKHFQKPLVRIYNIAASAILGTGKPVPILNANDLLQLQNFDTISKGNIIQENLSEAENLPHILLAEDSITTRMLLKNIFELSGFLVTTAVDGLDAYEKLKTKQFNLIVSDVEMPRMDGFELTKKIRENPNFEHLPIVLVTSREADADREKGIDFGANAYILKSTFDSSNLLDIVKRLSL